MAIVELPSGLSGEVRSLSGKDGRFLSNEKLIQDNQIEDYVLRNCWIATADPGPYPFTNGVDWGDVLIGDRLVAVIHIRQATYPNDPYDLPIKCPSKVCGNKFHWEIDLHELLKEKMKKLPASSAKVMKEGGGNFPIVIPSTETKASFSLLTANSRRAYMKWQDQLRAKAQQDKKMNKEDMTNDLVNAAVFWNLKVEGIDKLLKRQEFLEDLPLGALIDLRNIVEAADCGVDTEIEIECPKCSVSWKTDLPFTREFFAPKRKTATLAKSSETETEGVEGDGSSP
jgi:hypothetical protein